MAEFLALCPWVVKGKHLAITAVDSGAFAPSESDRAAGWTTSGDIAYSPRLESLEALPDGSCCRGCSGCDEWYLFATAPGPLGAICGANIFEIPIARPNVFQFINFVGFRISDPRMDAISDLFWKQMEWIRPVSYLGDGNRGLVFVSSDEDCFSRVCDVLREGSGDSR